MNASSNPEQPWGDPCPICGRVDGGHDQTVHDMVDRGGKAYPRPNKVAAR